jgi:DNA polymerase III alpha subunit
MNYDQFGRPYTTSDEIISLLYKNPKLDLGQLLVIDPEIYNNSVEQLHADLPKLQQYQPLDISVHEFDQLQQQQWFMPAEYQQLDIARYVLELCKTEAELQRVGQELLLYQERNLFPLLCYLKYLVDTLRQHSIVWGVGRGSSVASYVLYLIGVHKINSIYYDLPIEEFLKG